MEEGPSQPHPDPQDPLMVAYDQRVLQLYDARAALSGAVAALTVELSEARAQIRTLCERQDVLREHADALERELAAVRGMKVVRWTKWPRTLVYSLRARRR